jgi:hypothetical protein
MTRLPGLTLLIVLAALGAGMREAHGQSWPWSKDDKPTVVETLPDTPDLSSVAVRAAGAIPGIQAQQPITLLIYQAEWKADADGWSFRCERWGDYLAVYFQRGEEKTVKAIPIGKDTIRFTPGHEPDLGGTDHFSIGVSYDKNGHYSKEVEVLFEGEPIPGEKKINYDDTRPLPVGIDKLARKAADDVISFGAGGQTYWANAAVYPGAGAFVGNSMQTLQSVPVSTGGDSISVPAGLGQAVYDEILHAIGKGP